MTDAVLYVVVIAVAGFALYWLCRPPKPPYLKARWDDDTQGWVNEEPHDVGPDSLRLLDDLEAEMKAYGARLADLYEPAATIRDDRQKGASDA